MQYQIWYMRPEFFRDGILGSKTPQASDLTATHVHLKDIEAHGLDAAWCAMQGEVWSPNGEARELIKSKGLQHTSMSVGDVIVDDVGNAHAVAGCGFKAIGGITIKEQPMQRLTENDLRQFTGGDEFYRHSLMRNISYSEGVKHLAEVGGAYWLIDKVATLQLAKEIKRQEFQVWKLTVDDEHAAVLDCNDGNGNAVYSESINWTDFPLAEITLWFANNVIYLPSEH